MGDERRNCRRQDLPMAFDGSDAHAEVIERLTGLTFLGDATEEIQKLIVTCLRKPTKRKVILAKTY